MLFEMKMGIIYKEILYCLIVIVLINFGFYFLFKYISLRIIFFAQFLLIILLKASSKLVPSIAEVGKYTILWCALR